MKGSIAAPYYLARATADIADADLACINATVITDYMLAARFALYMTVIHAREIPNLKAMPLVRGLVQGTSLCTIFNYQEANTHFGLG